MSHFINSSRAFKPEDLRVDASGRPDWVSGTVRMPKVGEHVLCTGGLAEVVQLLGKTSDGKHPPFFVAASNILVPPEGYVGGGLNNGMIG